MLGTLMRMLRIKPGGGRPRRPSPEETMLAKSTNGGVWFDWMGVDRLDREAYTAAVRSEFFGKFDADTRTEHAA